MSRRHSLPECRDAIQTVITEKNRMLGKIRAGDIQASKEDRQIREYWLGVLCQVRDDYDARLKQSNEKENDNAGT